MANIGDVIRTLGLSDICIVRVVKYDGEIVEQLVTRDTLFALVIALPKIIGVEKVSEIQISTLRMNPADPTKVDIVIESIQHVQNPPVTH